MIDNKELKIAMRALGFEPKRGEIKQFLKQVGNEDIKAVDSKNFQELVQKRLLERDPAEEMMKAFQLFDDDGTGKISVKNLKRVAQELGENMSEEEIAEILGEADRDGDGEISMEEFMRIARKTDLF